MVDIKEKITKLKNAKGWSDYELAKRANVNRTTLHNLFNEKTSPRVDTLISICEAFGVTISEFFNENTTNSEMDFLIISYKSLDDNKKEIIKKIFELLM